MKRIFLAVLLGFALGVTGCGGGDGNKDGTVSSEDSGAATTEAPAKEARHPHRGI